MVVLPTPNLQPAVLEEQWVCFFFRFLTANLPGPVGPTCSYAVASKIWWTIATLKPRHHSSRSFNP